MFSKGPQRNQHPENSAIQDGDHIECIIRETGVNQDGRTTGITMPSNTTQTALIRETYAKAGLDIENLHDRPQIFHAHGTGTPAGDPQEAEAISRAFPCHGKQEAGKLYVGSIKTVIGHTEGTAGLASLIGSSLAIQHRVIPPNMHFDNLSENVAPFYNGPEICKKARPWPFVKPGQPRRASVNRTREGANLPKIQVIIAIIKGRERLLSFPRTQGTTSPE